jgi:hypothetical protein
MATPHIVGLVSVMKSFDKNLTTKKIKKLFKENSIKANYESGKYIAGFPDVEKIVKELTENNSPIIPFHKEDEDSEEDEEEKTES